MKLTLTLNEIEEITGCKQAAAQESWFRDNHIPVFPKRGGGITVARAWFENAPLQRTDIIAMPKSGSKPDMSKVGRRHG